MKSIIAVAFAGFIASVSAQSLSAPSLSDMPSCALPCLLSGLTAAGCGATDFKCACSSQDYISASKSCIDAVCSTADQQRSLAVTGGLCSAAGVPITVPSGSAAVSSPAASSSASSSSAASDSAASASAESTGSADASPSAAPSSTNSGNATTHTSGTPSSTSPASQETSNAASRAGALGGVVALGLVAAALAL